MFDTREIAMSLLRSFTLAAALAAPALAFAQAADAKKDAAGATAEADSQPAATAEWTAFPAPVTIVDAMEYLDGGTTYVRLRDGKGKSMWLCVSQHGFDGVVPPNTLFLDGVHPDQQTARLPLTDREASLVVDSLERGVEASLSAAERESLAKMGDPAEARLREQYSPRVKQQQSPQKWAAIYAFDALRRLRGRESHAVLDEKKSNPPQWHAGYLAARAELHAQEERDRRAEELFVSFYPAEARKHFQLSRKSDLEFEELEQLNGKRLSESISDPVELALATCRALGTRHESWSMTESKDRIAIAAVQTVSGSDFAKALERCKDDPSATLGGARIFFALGYGKSLTEEQRIEWGLRLAEAVLESDLDDDKPHVVGYVSRMEDSKAVELLWRAARGEAGKEMKLAEDRREPSLQATALLALAGRRDPGAKAEIEERLSKAGAQDRTAYEVALALLGDPNYVKNDNFATESHAVALGAIRAIEQFQGAHGMDALIEAGLDHPWAAVRNEALLAVQRLTGQEWHKDSDRRQAGAYGDEAKAWWKENRKEFLAKHAGEE
jgi:hypothetical protein